MKILTVVFLKLVFSEVPHHHLQYCNSDPFASCLLSSPASSSNTVQQNTYCVLICSTTISHPINFFDMECNMPPALWASFSALWLSTFRNSLLTSIPHSPCLYQHTVYSPHTLSLFNPSLLFCSLFCF